MSLSLNYHKSVRKSVDYKVVNNDTPAPHFLPYRVGLAHVQPEKRMLTFAYAVAL